MKITSNFEIIMITERIKKYNFLFEILSSFHFFSFFYSLHSMLLVFNLNGQN